MLSEFKVRKIKYAKNELDKALQQAKQRREHYLSKQKSTLKVSFWQRLKNFFAF